MQRQDRLSLVACLVFVPALTLACDSPTAPAPEALVAPVTFEYTSLAVAASPPPLGSTGCSHHNQNNKLYGSWSPEVAYRQVEGDCRSGCSVTVGEVPVGIQHVVWFVDLGYCNADPIPDTLEAYEVLRGNGVLLTQVLDHPSGRRGAAFRVDASGRVTP